MVFKRPLLQDLLRWSLYGKVGVVGSRRSDDNDTGDKLNDGPCFDSVCRMCL
jgi:hypothetical protein